MVEKLVKILAKNKKVLANAGTKTLGFIVKHKTEIKLACGLTGSVAAVVLSAKATEKSVKQIAEKETELGRELTKKEKIKLTWKNYIWTVGVEAVSIASTVSSMSDEAKKYNTLLSAYNLAERALDEKKKENTVLKTAKDMVTGETREVVEEYNGTLIDTTYYDFVDTHSALKFKSTIAKMKDIISDLKSTIYISNGFLSRDDLYRCIDPSFYIDGAENDGFVPDRCPFSIDFEPKFVDGTLVVEMVYKTIPDPERWTENKY